MEQVAPDSGATLMVRDGCLSDSSDLGTPLVKSGFEPGQKLHGDHSRDREDEYAHKYFIGLKRGTRHRDHKADARRCGIKLANHDADQRPAHPES